MASPVFSDNILRREVKRLDQQKSSFAKYINTEYSGELQGKASIVFVPVMTNIALSGSSITGASGMTLGTWPGQAIGASSSTFALEPIKLSKYTNYREQITDFQVKHSKVPLEQAIGANLAVAKDVLLDNFVRDLILVDKIASIPAGNKINSGAPIAIATGTVIEVFGKCTVALDKQNAGMDRVCFVSAEVADVYQRAQLLTNTEMGAEMLQAGYLGKYRGTPIIYSAALNASNEMVMMEKGTVHAVVEDYGTKSKDGVDGNYFNVFTELVYGGEIFSVNLPKIAVAYFI